MLFVGPAAVAAPERSAMAVAQVRKARSLRMPLLSESTRGPKSTLPRELAPVLALVVLAVLARSDRGPPPLVVAVPLDGLLEALREAAARLPAQLADLRGRQGVAAVVPG